MPRIVPLTQMLTLVCCKRCGEDWGRTRASLVTVAASSTVCAKTETQSSDAHAGTTPAVDSRPTVGLMPTHPLNIAGTRPATMQGVFPICVCMVMVATNSHMTWHISRGRTANRLSSQRVFDLHPAWSLTVIAVHGPT